MVERRILGKKIEAYIQKHGDGRGPVSFDVA